MDNFYQIFLHMDVILNKLHKMNELLLCCAKIKIVEHFVLKIDHIRMANQNLNDILQSFEQMIHHQVNVKNGIEPIHSSFLFVNDYD